MKNKDITKQLLPGIIVGLILGFGLTMIVGVDTINPIPNYIGGAMCCFVPTLLNCIIVLNGTAKTLKRKITFGNSIKRTIPYAISSLILGFIIVAIVVEKILEINTCTIPIVTTAIYQAILGVIVSTVSAYFVLKKYESDVKYTKRK